MNHDPANELFIPYVSGWLRSQLQSTALRPGSTQEINATVLYADLNGFSTLTAAFARMPDGAERLHAALTRCYSTLIAVIREHDGDVVAIAGDALTAWWPQQLQTAQAERCAAAMLDALATLPPVPTPNGPFRLEMRIGIAAGAVRMVLAGLPTHGVHLVILGPALEAATTAERQATPGQVRVASVAAAPLGNSAAPLSPPHAVAPLADNAAPGRTYLHLEHFLPPSFAARLRIGALVAEYRRCVPAFASFTLPATTAALHDLVARVQTIVARWGGWLNEIEVGNKGAVFVILFGAPIAHGDDAARAVSCCLELQACNLITHVGITIGTLFMGAVGGPSRRVYTAQGDEMNMAAHLMQAAAPSALLISSRIYREIAGRYQVSEPTLVTVKGQGQVAVRQVLSALPHHDQPGASALIGRWAERSVLDRVVAAASAGQAQVLLIEGESGIGKSSMLQELRTRWLRHGYAVFSSECLSGQADALATWRPIISALCGIDATMPLAVQQAQIAAILAILPPNLANKRPHATLRLLIQLLGLEPPDHSDATAMSIPSNQATIVANELLDLVVALVQRRLAQGPVLLVIEDIHWADTPSLVLAARIAQSAQTAGDRRVPLLLALSHRPMDTTHPALATLRTLPTSVRLPLHSLSGTESLELCRVLLDVPILPDELAHIIIRHAEGQPLFLKEYLKTLCERQLISISANQVVLRGNPTNVQLSDTAQGIIQARMDRLDEATRLTLKVAAVIGSTIPLALLYSIHPATPTISMLQSQLEQLRELNIIELELEGPEQVYRFKHGITHEVAYASLLFEQRRKLHTAVAHWYESAYSDDLAQHQAAPAIYELLAYHYGRAENQAKQAHYCAAVAIHATRWYANARALEYLSTALALSSDPHTRFALLLLRFTLNERLGEHTRQFSDSSELMALAGQLDDLCAVQASYCRLRSLLVLGNNQAVFAEAPQLQRQAEQLAQRSTTATAQTQALLVQAGCLDTQSQACVRQGDLSQARMFGQQALTLCRWVLDNQSSMLPRSAAPHDTPFHTAIAFPAALDPIEVMVRCLNHLGMVYLQSGELLPALACHQKALHIARTHNDWPGAAHALSMLSQIHILQGNSDTAVQYSEHALAISQATGDRNEQARALQILHCARATGQTVAGHPTVPTTELHPPNTHTTHEIAAPYALANVAAEATV